MESDQSTTQTTPTEQPSEKQRLPNKDREIARNTVKLKLVFDYCRGNPTNDPYLALTGDLLLEYPHDEEQIIHNFIRALSDSNKKLAAMVANLEVQLAAASGTSRIIPPEQNIKRGRGILPYKGKGPSGR